MTKDILMIDFLDTEMDASQRTNLILGLSKCLDSKLIVTKVIYNDDTWYYITEDFYKWLQDIIEASDCKNGCQIYFDGTSYYWQITGAFNGKYFETTKIYLKPFEW